MKPLIGISVESKQDPENPRTHGSLSLNWNYAQMVADAGGTPILIPPMADVAELAPLLDGFLIPGGADIDAARWGQDNHAKNELQDPARFDGEKALLDALDPETPVFGICYGCQFINVYLGGDLVQHVPDVVGHEAHSGGTLQRYEVAGDTKLAGVVGAQVEGKSYHHQAIGRLAEGLTVNARHDDGTIEGVEFTGPRWMVGVQWHPERTPDDPATRRLFETFVQAAAEHRRKRQR